MNATLVTQNFTKIGKLIDVDQYTFVGHHIHFKVPSYGGKMHIEIDAKLDVPLNHISHEQIKSLGLGHKGKGCTCNICGHHITKGAFITKDGCTIHVIGLDCADTVLGVHIDEDKTKGEYLSTRQKRIKAERLQKVYSEYEGLQCAIGKGKHYIIKDIASRLDQYHTISEAQAKLVLKLYAEEVDKQNSISSGVLVVVPNAEIKGGIFTVLSHKNTTNYYGNEVSVIHFRHSNGWKACYKGSASKAIQSASVGKTLRMDCDVIQSEYDPSFGWIKRPSNISIA